MTCPNIFFSWLFVFRFVLNQCRTLCNTFSWKKMLCCKNMLFWGQVQAKYLQFEIGDTQLHMILAPYMCRENIVLITMNLNSICKTELLLYVLAPKLKKWLPTHSQSSAKIYIINHGCRSSKFQYLYKTFFDEKSCFVVFSHEWNKPQWPAARTCS